MRLALGVVCFRIRGAGTDRVGPGDARVTALIREAQAATGRRADDHRGWIEVSLANNIGVTFVAAGSWIANAVFKDTLERHLSVSVLLGEFQAVARRRATDQGPVVGVRNATQESGPRNQSQ